MSLPLDLQFYAFFVTVLGGMALGVLADLDRACVDVLRPRGWWRALAAVASWTAAAALAAAVLLLGNWGELRLYALLGAGLGLFTYRGLVGSAFYRLARWAVALAAAAVRRVRRCVGGAIGAAGRAASRPLRRGYRKVGGEVAPRLAHLRRRAAVQANRLRRWLLAPPGDAGLRQSREGPGRGATQRGRISGDDQDGSAVEAGWGGERAADDSRRPRRKQSPHRQ